MTVVDTIYDDFRDAAKILREARELSLQIMLEANLRKALLLSAASYFEIQLTREVQSFTDEVTSGNVLIATLVQQKAISRQYHAWFDWEKSNANKFFDLFGPTFKDHMASVLSESPELTEDIKAFLEIGNRRNLLVHSDYASYFIDKTPDEIYVLYQSAIRFVGRIGQELRACSVSNAAAAVEAANEPDE